MMNISPQRGLPEIGPKSRRKERCSETISTVITISSIYRRCDSRVYVHDLILDNLQMIGGNPSSDHLRTIGDNLILDNLQMIGGNPSSTSDDLRIIGDNLFSDDHTSSLPRCHNY